MGNHKILDNMDKIDIDKELKCDAIYHIGECLAVRNQIIRKKNILITAKVNGFEIAICDNNQFIALLNNEIKQAELCLESKTNNFMLFLPST